ncbi:hypothetical protein HKD37_02G004891 [Glycine soja]
MNCWDLEFIFSIKFLASAGIISPRASPLAASIILLSMLLSPLGPSRFFLQKVVASGGSKLARLGELDGKLLPYFAINRGRSEEGRVKIKGLDVTSLKELGRLMGPLQRQAFRKVYGKILDLTVAEVFTEAVVSLAQYYDQALRCFTFGDFQIVPTVEEFEEILGCPLGGRKLYLFSGFLPSLSKIAVVVGDSARELDRMKQTRNGVVGLPQKYLEGKARDMASQEEWVPFADILALLIFGVVVFPNMDGLVDLAAIDPFLAYHLSKESPMVAILEDLFDTFDRRCEKNSARIVCYLPALCVWLVLHIFRQDITHLYPLQSYRLCVEKRRVDWDQYLAGIGGSTINWFPRWKEGKEGVLLSCGDYPNVPLIGTRGCINYNPTLVIRRLGYPMRGAPTEESLSPFLVRDFGAQSLKVVQRVHKAWKSPLRKDKELRGIRNGIIGGYHEWLRVHTRGLDWLSKLKVINEENFEAPGEDEEVQALKLKLGKARLAKEKFKSAATTIWKECTGLREENAATARALEQETKRAYKEEHGRDKFRGALWGSNNELMLWREERDQSRVHGMILKEELAICLRSKKSLAQHLEATERSMLAIIRKYKEELNQFALTLNGSQDLLRLLAKAKAITEVCSAPEESHGLINYCQHMIDLMAHIIRNHDNAMAAASNTAREAELVLQPAINLGRDRNTTIFGRRYSPQAYPYGLPPDFTPRTAPDDLSKAPTFEGQLPPYADYPLQEDDEGDAHLGPLLPLKDLAPHELPQPNIVRHVPNTTPIPMAYSELWPSLLENHLVVAIPGKVFQPPYPKWYNSNAKCAYHSGAPGHNIDSCLPFKYKVQHLINVGWLSFQEEGPNIKTNPLASHGGASVNAIKKDGPLGAKRLEDVATSRRFIYQSLQAACMVSRGGDESNECLFPLRESHDMETCPAVEELLQWLMDWEQLESEEKKVPPTPKALVICFTRNVTGSRPMYPPTAPKPTPFSYQSNKAALWKYTPPAFGERAATEVDSLSAKVTNITGLSSVTRSGRVFAPPHSAELPSKGKAPINSEPHRALLVKVLNEAHVAYDISVEAIMVARVMLKHGYEPGMGLGKDSHRNADVVDIRGNPYKYGLGYEPGKPGRRNSPSRLRENRAWPDHVSQCFTSAGIMFEEEVAAIGEESPPDPPSFVRPCHPNSQVGNWRVISQSEVYTADSIYEGRFFEDPNNEGSIIDFDREVSQTINEEEEEDVLSPELERLIAQEERIPTRCNCLVTGQNRLWPRSVGETKVKGRNQSRVDDDAVTICHTLLFPTFRYLGTDANRE